MLSIVRAKNGHNDASMYALFCIAANQNLILVAA